MKKNILFILFSLFILSSNAQTTQFKPFWNTKLSFYTAESQFANKISFLELSGSYRIKRSLDVGLFTGYGKVSWLNNGGNVYENVINLGINANFHILPFFIKADNLKPDIYMSGKLGGAFTESSRDYYNNDKNKFRMIYGVHLGFAYNFGKHFGIFIEPGVQKLNDIEFNTHVGLSYRF